MMDIFTEYIVKHRLEAKDVLIQIGTGFLAMILTVLAFGLTAIPGISFLITLIIAGIWYGAYWVIKSRYVEYEYILTNSALDFDKIMARSKRKRLLSLDLKEIEILAPVNNDAYKNQATKIYDCTGDGKNGVYFIDFMGERGRERVLFQPSEKILDFAYKFNPSKIFIEK